MKNLKYFYGSIIVTIIGIVIGESLYPSVALVTTYTILILVVLEVSLSFDNAILNAKILGQMSKKWQKIFIFIGLPIAVFGMRLLFPILLVKLTSSISFIEVIHIVLNDPIKYHKILEYSMPYICIFGGSFLLMVFLHFLFNQNKGKYWIPFIENNKVIIKIRGYKGGYIFCAIVIGFIVIYNKNIDDKNGLIIAFLLGIILYESLNLINFLFNSTKMDTFNLCRNGLIGFIYLEIIDATFSLDSVVGAFAITTNIIIIMIGLGIGSMFVRSLTIFFLKKKTLDKYIYLEHGAHYAIGFLAVILLLRIFINIPEWFSGSIGLLILLVSYFHSIRSLSNSK